MGLCVLDLRVLNPATVALVSWADSPGNARAVAVAGDHAFVADGREGLAVFRIDGGETPIKVAQYVLNGFSVAIALRDNLVALAANAGGVHFLDVSDPADPIYVGTTATSFATGVVFSPDGYCLVADANEGLLVLGGRGPFRDTTPPWRVTDLTTNRPSVMTMDLRWTMTGDDGMVGQAAGVEVRVAQTPIDDLAAWEAAAVAPGVVDVVAPGTAAVFTVTGLDPATAYHFAVRVHDRAGNTSGLSNPATGTTTDGIVLYDAGVDRLGGTDTDLFTFAVEAIYSEPFTVAEVVINGVPRALEHVGDFQYRHQTTLPFGIYSFYFRFAAAGAPEVVTDPDDHGRILVGALFFTMGSPADEPGRGADEVQHAVVLSRILVAGATEVTQAEWDAVMPAGSNPSVHQGAAQPVDSVTWLEAIAYCNARSLVDGLQPAYMLAGSHVTWDREADGWRLPTEAEWEYLNRAGAETALTNGPLTRLHCNLDPNLDAIGWYCGNAGSGPRPVAQKQPNALGLYDMSGNVREWCWDWYGELTAETVADPAGPDSGYLRVCRGGSWHNASQDCRSAARAALPPDSADDTVGLRVVRTVFDD
jgi:formylglycine-generating enzyme required for sulfatase activity